MPGTLAPLLALLISATLAPLQSPRLYEKDLRYALGELEKRCGRFFELKGIDWRKVSREFRAEARSVKTPSDHLVLLTRLLARLRDGHAALRPLEKGRGVAWPDRVERTGPGMFWCRSGKRILIKNSWSSARASGVEPGMVVLQVDGKPAQEWLESRIQELRDTRSFSTEQQAFFYASHWGLADPPGTRRKLLLLDSRGKKRRCTITYTRANPVPWGPAFFPSGLEGGKDVRYGRTKKGFGYVHIRRCKSRLPAQVDAALAAIGEVPGLILDFRANGGGGFDHQAFMGSFIPRGKAFGPGRRYRSAGATPYGGPIVVIVDGNTRSAGETASGILKEHGRGWMIGESATAGMSSQKESIPLPSGLFSLYVSVRSNMRSFNGRRGIEGIGVVPHEIVEYRSEDLAEGKDTLTARAEDLLLDHPWKKLAYDPEKFGWRPPKR